MALIHQRLYQSDNPELIDMSVYIAQLVDHLRDGYDNGRYIRFELSIESLRLDVAQVVPLGLILNEAVTNAIKYAFPEGPPGTIKILLALEKVDWTTLAISDDGIGLSEESQRHLHGSMGIHLMAGFVEQLDGTMQIINEHGVHIRIGFRRQLPDEVVGERLVGETKIE